MCLCLVSLLLGLGAHRLVEPREVSACRVVGWKESRTSNEDRSSRLEVDGLEFRVRERSRRMDWSAPWAPVVLPVLDSASRRVFWIALDEVCEMDLRTHRGKTLLRQRGIGAIGRMWISGRSLHVRGGSSEPCREFDLGKATIQPIRLGSGDSVSCVGNPP